MGPGSIREYTAAMRRRYVTASKDAKGVLLDEFCAVTGYHRRSAMRALGRKTALAPGQRQGRRREYGPEVAAALRDVWEASGRLGSKRLAPFLPELVAALERHGELQCTLEVRAQLLTLSASTIDRLLKPWRPKGLRQPHRAAPAAASVRAQVPVRTFGEWQGVTPGTVQADLVLHCGETTAGFYLATLVVVDVATSWTECEPVWGLTQQRVAGALDRIRRRLPFPLRELHTDNGSEFLNRELYAYCQRHGIRLTRGRPYKKNDQAYVEQRNGELVRRLVGYGRYETRVAFQQLQRLYPLITRQLNCFRPVAKLVGKVRTGARVSKRYDAPCTPYQRLLAASVLTAGAAHALRSSFEATNPRGLQAAIERTLDALWREEVRPPVRASRPQEALLG